MTPIEKIKMHIDCVGEICKENNIPFMFSMDTRNGQCEYFLGASRIEDLIKPFSVLVHGMEKRTH